MTHLQISSALPFHEDGPGFALPIFKGAKETKMVQEIDQYTQLVIGFRNLVGDAFRAVAVTGGSVARIGAPQVYAFMTEDGAVCAGTLDELSSILREFMNRAQGHAGVALQIAELIGTVQEKQSARMRVRNAIGERSGLATATRFYLGSVLRTALWDGVLKRAADDDATIVAGILHETASRSVVSMDELNEEFGAVIGGLVAGVCNIQKLDFDSPLAGQYEELQKLLVATVNDVRVLLLRFAICLQTMRALEVLQPEERRRIAREARNIFAPLAQRLGMYTLRQELEDRAFRELEPAAYAVIAQRLTNLLDRSPNLISKMEEQLARGFSGGHIQAALTGEQKGPYQIWQKIERKSGNIDQLSDIFIFRVVVENEDDCYRALGLIHRTWPAVPGRVEDYISAPKQNGYRSVHTTVVGPADQQVELQICTREMNEVANYGIAAQALYKDGAGSAQLLSRESNAYAWLRRTIALLAEGSNPEEFLEHTKLELFQDQVFCFTPKGKLIALPRRATPIDFAYAVHTDVGNQAIGCKINGKIAPLASELQNGDEVEILTSKAQAAPPAAWESLVATRKARAAMRRATRQAVRTQYAELGRRIVERVCQRAMRDYSDDVLSGALPRLDRHSIDDVFAAVGRGEMKASDVIRAMYPDYKEERGTASSAPSSESDWFGLIKGKAVKFRVPGGKEGDSALTIPGISSELPVRFAPDGGAVPGDRIVGIMTPGEGITIYPIQSSALKSFEDTPDRWLDVRWDVDDSMPQRFPARIVVQSINEPGSLAQIAQLIAEHDGDIDNIRMSRQSPDFTSVTIDLEVYDLKHLTAIIAQLRAKPVVAKAERVNG